MRIPKAYARVQDKRYESRKMKNKQNESHIIGNNNCRKNFVIYVNY